MNGQGLVKLAAFFGAVYLTTSLVFVLHIGSRIGALRSGRISHDLLDAGLILAVMSTLVAATPAILGGATDISGSGAVAALAGRTRGDVVDDRAAAGGRCATAGLCRADGFKASRAPEPGGRAGRLADRAGRRLIGL
jgi:hypothetical protein